MEQAMDVDRVLLNPSEYSRYLFKAGSIRQAVSIWGKAVWSTVWTHVWTVSSMVRSLASMPATMSTMVAKPRVSRICRGMTHLAAYEH
jgi:hypothetical protein